MEDSMYIPLGGIFLIFLLLMCLDALSCVTVNITVIYSLRVVQFV
jgi:hypothetical protein